MGNLGSAHNVSQRTSSAGPARRALATWLPPFSRLSAVQAQQQALLAGFGRHALDGDDLGPLLDEASAIAAAGLGAEHATILEHSAEDGLFEVRSSAGWGAAAPRGMRVSADPQSVAGHALRTGQPDVWFQALDAGATRGARHWLEHDIRSAICVPIGTDEAGAFGVLEVCGCDDRSFAECDRSYLRSLAGILAAAIESHRQRLAWAGQLTATASKLRAAEEELLAKDSMVREAWHRIANSLQMLRSLLQVQARHVADPDARAQVEGAMQRVAAVGTLHRRMCDADAGLSADAKDYLGGMLDEMQATLPDGSDRALVLDMEPFMLAAGDLTAVGLITGELVTNAIKYGHGTVAVQVRRQPAGLEISVSDDGGGFPPDFDVAKSRGIGMRLVVALARSSGGDVATVDRSVSHGRIVVRTGFGGADEAGTAPRA